MNDVSGHWMPRDEEDGNERRTQIGDRRVPRLRRAGTDNAESKGSAHRLANAGNQMRPFRTSQQD